MATTVHTQVSSDENPLGDMTTQNRPVEVAIGALLGLAPVVVALFLVWVNPSLTLCADDSVTAFQPIVTAQLRQIFEGRWPIWTDAIGCGYPLYGAALIQPATIVAHLICVPLGFPYHEIVGAHLLYLWFGTLFTWLYLRKQNCERGCALLGAMAFGFAGPLWGLWFNWPNYGFLTCMFPAAFFSMECLRGPRTNLLAMLGWGMIAGNILLLGDPSLILKFTVLCGAYLATYVLTDRDWRLFVRVAFGSIFAACLGIAQPLATAQMATSSYRVLAEPLSFEQAFGWSMDLPHFAGFVFPFTKVSWGLSLPPLTGAGVAVGPLLLSAMACLAISFRKLRKVEWFVLAALIVYALMAAGRNWPPNELGRRLPILDQFRWPMRWNVELSFLGAITTGVGIQRLKDHAGTPLNAIPIPLTILATLSTIFARNDFETEWGSGVVYALIVIYIVAHCVLFYLERMKLRKALLGFAVGFTLLSLVATRPLAMQNLFSADLRGLYTHPISIELEGHERALVLGDRSAAFGSSEEGNFLFDIPCIFGHKVVHGYVFPLRWQFWYGPLDAQGTLWSADDANAYFLNQNTPALLQMTRVGAVMIGKNRPDQARVADLHPDLEFMKESTQFRIYRHKGFREPAWFVERVLPVRPDEYEVGDMVRLRTSFAAFVAQPYKGEVSFKPGSRVLQFDEDHGRISMKVDSPDGGFLVTSNTWYHDWFAQVDGREAKLERVNEGFLGLAVPAGAREIVMEYRPLWLIRLLSLHVTCWLGSFLALGILILANLRSGNPSKPRASHTQVAPEERYVANA